MLSFNADELLLDTASKREVTQIGTFARSRRCYGFCSRDAGGRISPSNSRRPNVCNFLAHHQPKAWKVPEQWLSR